jgi:serine/threonine protein kinase
VTALDEVYQEIDIMRKLNHPNLMRVFEIIDSPLSEKLYLVMPVADYGECMSFDGATHEFVPNHRLQAKNVNKIMKSKSALK